MAKAGAEEMNWRDKILGLLALPTDDQIAGLPPKLAEQTRLERDAALDPVIAEIEAAVAVAEADMELERIRGLSSKDEPKPGTLAWQELISSALLDRLQKRAAYRRLKERAP
jgi:hypothetical protein